MTDTQATMSFVATDLEGTLTTGRTWSAAADYLTKHGQGLRYWLDFGWRYPVIVVSKLGMFNPLPFQHRWMRDLLTHFAGMTQADFVTAADWMVDKHLWPNRREAVVTELAQHLAAGRQVVLASGTYQPVLEAFARKLANELGYPPEHVHAVGTPFVYEADSGQNILTGKLATDMSTGDVKRTRLEAFLSNFNGNLHTAYGDTAADIAMLDFSAEAVAVHPDDGLAEASASHNWRIIND
ncbi:MAG: haloacid dehalogenase-like hydrolase [Deinococcota bacterium]